MSADPKRKADIMRMILEFGSLISAMLQADYEYTTSEETTTDLEEAYIEVDHTFLGGLCMNAITLIQRMKGVYAPNKVCAVWGMARVAAGHLDHLMDIDYCAIRRDAYWVVLSGFLVLCEQEMHYWDKKDKNEYLEIEISLALRLFRDIERWSDRISNQQTLSVLRTGRL